MIGKSLSCDEVDVRGRFSILYFAVIRTHDVRETREEVSSFGDFDVVRRLRRSSAYGERDTVAM